MSSSSDNGFKDLFNAFFTTLGKSRTEAIEIVGREMGKALAAMLKEPLAQLVNHRKLKITVEMVPRHSEKKSRSTTKQR